MLLIFALWGPDANTSLLLLVSLWRSVHHSAVEFYYTACSKEMGKSVVAPRDIQKEESDTYSYLIFHSSPGLTAAQKTPQSGLNVSYKCVKKTTLRLSL